MFRWMLEDRCFSSVFEHDLGWLVNSHSLYGLPSGWSKVVERLLPGVYQNKIHGIARRSLV
jgi:hypothetical protein